MYRHISLICKIASVQVFTEESNDEVSIPEIASFWDKKFTTLNNPQNLDPDYNAC